MGAGRDEGRGHGGRVFCWKGPGQAFGGGVVSAEGRRRERSEDPEGRKGGRMGNGEGRDRFDVGGATRKRVWL